MAESLRLASTPRTRNATTLINEIAARQEGVIARWQLLICGLSNARIARWIVAGRLHRLHPGVYAVGHRNVGERGRLIAALFYAGRGAALSHLCAAWWLDLVPTRPGVIQVSAPGRKASVAGVELHHPRRIDRVMYRGLPVVGVPTALLQVAQSLPFAATRKALAQAEFRRLLELDALRAALGGGRDGSAVLRRALHAHMPQLAHTQNDFEADFLLLCERFGIPLPEVNVRVGRYRPDMLWRDLNIVVELDGKDAHTNPAQIARDHRRDLALRAMGYTVIRYTWAQVNYETEAVAEDLRTQLDRARRQ